LQGVYFLTNAISSTFHAIPARVLAEGMPMHVLQQAEVKANDDGTFSILLDPGEGSAPDAEGLLSPSAAQALSPPWSDCFSSFHDFLAYCVPQDRALSSQPWHSRLTLQEISLGIPLDSCEPLVGTVKSNAARAITGDAAPLCFRVASVHFRFSKEERRRLVPLTRAATQD
jgi:hypothetical protein